MYVNDGFAKAMIDKNTISVAEGPCVKVAACRPFSSCPKVKRPVCGSDNRTYNNICHLKGRNCRLKRTAKGNKHKKLTVKYCGACGRGKRCVISWTQKCPDLKFCDQLLRAAVRYAESKKTAQPKNLKKNTKGNKRLPRLSRKKIKENKLKKKKLGKPSSKQANRKKTSSKKTSIMEFLVKNGKKSNSKTIPKLTTKPMKITPKKAYQVCGSDGVTYSSLCHLQVEQCNKMNRCQRLRMKHKGACKIRLGGRS